MQIQIRDEEVTDIDRVRDIVRAAFPTDIESKLVDALRANGKAIISLVAVNDTDVLGHILFSPVTITPAPPVDIKGIGLAPVAVHPSAQSKGIGSLLIHEGLSRCQALGFDYCVVLGGPKYYQRFGFERASRFGAQNEYGVDEEFMVVRFSTVELQGLVRYAPEFFLFNV